MRPSQSQHHTADPTAMHPLLNTLSLTPPASILHTVILLGNAFFSSIFFQSEVIPWGCDSSLFLPSQAPESHEIPSRQHPPGDAMWGFWSPLETETWGPKQQEHHLNMGSQTEGKVEPWSVLTSTFRYQPQQGQYQRLSGKKAQSVQQWTQKPPNWSSCFQTCPLHSPSPSFFYTKHPGSTPWKCNLMSTDLRIRSLSE